MIIFSVIAIFALIFILVWLSEHVDKKRLLLLAISFIFVAGMFWAFHPNDWLGIILGVIVWFVIPLSITSGVPAAILIAAALHKNRYGKFILFAVTFAETIMVPWQTLFPIRVFDCRVGHCGYRMLQDPWIMALFLFISLSAVSIILHFILQKRFFFWSSWVCQWCIVAIGSFGVISSFFSPIDGPNN